ncbi:MAG TPA: hypothetical protein VL979_07480 [Solirubrobacteraceae bacterium]|nr:hypothetical protein [Solirubrobacteraceae bacterium]
MTKILGARRRARAERERREREARHATTYVARDGRGRVIASH